MLKEWIDYNNNHPEGISPASIFKNGTTLHFDYYINNLDLKIQKPTFSRRFNTFFSP